jgi:hypothetical protein
MLKNRHSVAKASDFILHAGMVADAYECHLLEGRCWPTPPVAAADLTDRFRGTLVTRGPPLQ